MTVGRLAALFIFFLVLSSCGDISGIFPSSDSYLVKVNINDMPLDDGSPMIRSGDRIYPYFAVSVRGDPDVTGLLVYLRNQYGEISHSVKFVIGVPSDDRTDEETENGDGEEDDGTIREIVLRSFDQELPAFVLPDDTEIGPHTIVFQVLGGRAILRRTEIPIFYLGDAEFILRDISMSLPGLFGSRLVPPGTRVLLEARLDFDRRLDPYLIWHSGRNVISEGRARDGAGTVLWEAPGRMAFHPLRLEILPFPPVGIRRTLVGISREILLPVSATAESAGFFFGTDQGHPAQNRLAEGLFHLDPPEEDDEPEGPRLYSWYQFKGRLHDTLSTQEDLEPVDGNAPRWASMGHNYGLSTGDDDAFLLSPVRFFDEERDHGGGIFLFHIRPVADGTIFSVSFPSYSPAGGAWIDMASKGDAIVLRIGTSAATVEMPMFVSYSDPRTLVPAAVKFYIHPDRLEANLSLGENALTQGTVQAVRLSDALTGEAIVRLGGEPLGSWTRAPARVVTGPRHIPDEEPEPETDEPSDDTDPLEPDGATIPPPAFAETETIDPSITTIWNEFAVMLSSLPFPSPAEDVTDDGEYPEQETPLAGILDETPDAVIGQEGGVYPYGQAETGAEAALHGSTDAGAGTGSSA